MWPCAYLNRSGKVSFNLDLAAHEKLLPQEQQLLAHSIIIFE